LRTAALIGLCDDPNANIKVLQEDKHAIFEALRRHNAPKGLFPLDKRQLRRSLSSSHRISKA
jgi:hypothetical protein